MLRDALETLRALVELLRLACVTRFRFRSSYWQWRMHTAFGRGWPESRRQRLHALVDYGRWIARMRRFD